jgi:hypothetical protein
MLPLLQQHPTKGLILFLWDAFYHARQVQIRYPQLQVSKTRIVNTYRRFEIVKAGQRRYFA